MIDPEIAQKIESCYSLYLRKIEERQDNTLLVIVDEAIVSAATESLDVGGTTFTELRPIEITNDSRAFELSWAQYIVYSVRNESFALPRRDYEEVEFGRLVSVYRKSDLLDYAAKSTWASSDFPGPPTHIQIACLNHVIDVVAAGEPKIRQL